MDIFRGILLALTTPLILGYIEGIVNIITKPSILELEYNAKTVSYEVECSVSANGSYSDVSSMILTHQTGGFILVSLTNSTSERTAAGIFNSATISATISTDGCTEWTFNLTASFNDVDALIHFGLFNCSVSHQNVTLPEEATTSLQQIRIPEVKVSIQQNGVYTIGCMVKSACFTGYTVAIDVNYHNDTFENILNMADNINRTSNNCDLIDAEYYLSFTTKDCDVGQAFHFNCSVSWVTNNRTRRSARSKRLTNDVTYRKLHSPAVTTVCVPRNFCETNTDDKGYTWIYTEGGTLLNTTCPTHYSGLVTRECTVQGVFKPPFYNCTLAALTGKLDNTTTDVVLTTLRNVILPVTLYIGDLLTIQSILKTVVNKTKASQNETDDFVEIVSKVIDEENGVEWESRIEKEDKGAEEFIAVVDEFISKATETQKKNNYTKANIVLQFATVKPNSTVPQDINFPTELAKDPRWNTSSVSSVHLQFKAVADKGVQAYSVVLYKNLSRSVPHRLIQGDTQKQEDIAINSQLISVQMLPKAPDILDHETEFVFQAFQDISTSVAYCSFWNISANSGNGTWDTRGCHRTYANSTVFMCACNHLTNFALLISPYVPPKEHGKILSIISIVGISISAAAIVITIFLHAVYWKALKSDKNIVTMCLCVTLLIGNMIFISAVTKIEDLAGCTTVSIILHYIFLVVFFLMLAEGINVFIAIEFVFHKKSHLRQLLTGAFVLPAVIVGIAMGATKLEGYGTPGSCWLSRDNGLFWAFAGPAVLIIALNYVIIVILFRTMHHTTSFVGKTNVEKAKMTAMALAVISPVTGITWIVGIFSIDENTIWLQYVFCIFNSLQGVLIFIFHCVRNKQLRQAMTAMRKRKEFLQDFESPGIRITGIFGGIQKGFTAIMPSKSRSNDMSMDGLGSELGVSSHRFEQSEISMSETSVVTEKKLEVVQVEQRSSWQGKENGGSEASLTKLGKETLIGVDEQEMENEEKGASEKAVQDDTKDERPLSQQVKETSRYFISKFHKENAGILPPKSRSNDIMSMDRLGSELGVSSHRFEQSEISMSETSVVPEKKLEVVQVEQRSSWQGKENGSKVSLTKLSKGSGASLTKLGKETLIGADEQDMENEEKCASKKAIQDDTKDERPLSQRVKADRHSKEIPSKSRCNDIMSMDGLDSELGVSSHCFEQSEISKSETSVVTEKKLEVVQVEQRSSWQVKETGRKVSLTRLSKGSEASLTKLGKETLIGADEQEMENEEKCASEKAVQDNTKDERPLSQQVKATSRYFISIFHKEIAGIMPPKSRSNDIMAMEGLGSELGVSSHRFKQSEISKSETSVLPEKKLEVVQVEHMSSWQGKEKGSRVNLTNLAKGSGASLTKLGKETLIGVDEQEMENEEKGASEKAVQGDTKDERPLSQQVKVSSRYFISVFYKEFAGIMPSKSRSNDIMSMDRLGSELGISSHRTEQSEISKSETSVVPEKKLEVVQVEQRSSWQGKGNGSKVSLTKLSKGSVASLTKLGKETLIGANEQDMESEEKCALEKAVQDDTKDERPLSQRVKADRHSKEMPSKSRCNDIMSMDGLDSELGVSSHCFEQSEISKSETSVVTEKKLEVVQVEQRSSWQVKETGRKVSLTRLSKGSEASLTKLGKETLIGADEQEMENEEKCASEKAVQDNTKDERPLSQQVKATSRYFISIFQKEIAGILPPKSRSNDIMAMEGLGSELGVSSHRFKQSEISMSETSVLPEKKLEVVQVEHMSSWQGKEKGSRVNLTNLVKGSEASLTKLGKETLIGVDEQEMENEENGASEKAVQGDTKDERPLSQQVKVSSRYFISVFYKEFAGIMPSKSRSNDIMSMDRLGSELGISSHRTEQSEISKSETSVVPEKKLEVVQVEQRSSWQGKGNGSKVSLTKLSKGSGASLTKLGKETLIGANEQDMENEEKCALEKAVQDDTKDERPLSQRVKADRQSKESNAAKDPGHYVAENIEKAEDKSIEKRNEAKM